MTGQGLGPAVRRVALEPAGIARRFLRRRFVRDIAELTIGVLLLAAGALFLWAAMLGALLLIAGGYGLFGRRGALTVIIEPGRPMTAAKFARRRIALRDADGSLELRVRGQARKLPADDDAAVRVFGREDAHSVLVVVDPSRAAVVLGRVPGGR